MDSFQQGRVENVLNMFRGNQLHTPGQPMRVLPLMCQAVIDERARFEKLQRKYDATWCVRLKRAVRGWFSLFTQSQRQVFND